MKCQRMTKRRCPVYPVPFHLFIQFHWGVQIIVLLLHFMRLITCLALCQVIEKFRMTLLIKYNNKV